MRPLELVVRDGVSAPEWDELGPGGLWTSTRWLTAMGSRLPGRLQTFVLLAQDRPRLGACGAIVERLDAYEAYNLWDILFRETPVFEEQESGPRFPPNGWRASRAAWFPNLVLTSPGYVGDPIGPANGNPRVVRLFVERVCRWALEQGLKAVGWLFLERQWDFFDGSPYPPRFVPLTVRSRLPVQWFDLDGYFAHLAGGRAGQARRELRQLTKAGVCVDRLSSQPYLDDVLRLRCALLDKYGHQVDAAEERRRLAGLVEAFDDDLVLVAARSGADLVGFTLFVNYQQVWYAVLTGSDYTSTASRLAYFATTFYVPASLAGACGVKEIDYGISHSAAKVARGCETKPLHGYVVFLAGS